MLDHLQMGMELHHVREVIFVDHLDCGAYKRFYPEVTGDHKKEAKLHEKHMQAARDILATRFPNLKFEGYLMDLKGEIAKIKVKDDVKFDKKIAKKEADEFLIALRH